MSGVPILILDIYNKKLRFSLIWGVVPVREVA